MREPDAGLASRESRPRVLLVEDDGAAGRGLGRLLEAEGYAIVLVSDGSAALAALRQGPLPDFILTDLQLPDLDGREVARFARTLVPAPRVAVITGWDLDLSAQECADLGIEWVLPKPLYVPDLIARLTGPRAGSASAVEENTPP